MSQISGAQLIVRLLERQGVRTIAGVPGGAILLLYDAPGAQRANSSRSRVTSRARVSSPRACRASPASPRCASLRRGPVPPTWSPRSPMRN